MKYSIKEEECAKLKEIENENSRRIKELKDKLENQNKETENETLKLKKVIQDLQNQLNASIQSRISLEEKHAIESQELFQLANDMKERMNQEKSTEKADINKLVEEVMTPQKLIVRQQNSGAKPLNEAEINEFIDVKEKNKKLREKIVELEGKCIKKKLNFDEDVNFDNLIENYLIVLGEYTRYEGINEKIKDLKKVKTEYNENCQYHFKQLSLIDNQVLDILSKEVLHFTTIRMKSSYLL